MNPIYLIGYMGCGKTTLGHAVARAASMRFIDLDDYIEQREGMTVRQIFDTRGEEYFRRLEHDTLHELSALGNVIIATGGGTPCQPGLMDLMLATGTTVLLQTSIDRLHRRLAEGKATRPLLASLSDDELRGFITEALDKRMPHYSRAAARFDSTHLETAEEIAATAERFVRQFINHE